VLSRTLELRTTPPCRVGLRRRHVSHGLGPRLLAEESSDVATCPSAPDLASLSMWAPALPRVSWLRALLARVKSSGATTYPQTVDHMNKDSLSYSSHAASLACFQGTLMHYRSAYKACKLLQCCSTVQRRSN
jgi:hypothetical protein